MTRRTFIFDRAPKRVYWELTRACDLACRHCRADANPSRDPRELTLQEGRRLLESLAEFGGAGPRVILSGGDPLKRPDFWHLVEHGRALGLRVSVAPSGTATLTTDVVRQFKEAGGEAMSLSLDGSDAVRHDSFRGVAGSFARTVRVARAAVHLGLPFQVNTLVSLETLPDLLAIGDLVERLDAARWSLFFLIHLGRGRVLGQLTPAQCEQFLASLWERSRGAPFVIGTTEAPHYRRVVLQQLPATQRPGTATHSLAVRHAFGIRDGNGIMFVSHAGEIQPSGFLPLVASHARLSSAVETYREAPLFRRLRDPATFGGRCGRCEFRRICGGSRARAYAATGNPFGEDPLCAYEPGSRRKAAAHHR